MEMNTSKNSISIIVQIFFYAQFAHPRLGDDQFARPRLGDAQFALIAMLA